MSRMHISPSTTETQIPQDHVNDCLSPQSPLCNPLIQWMQREQNHAISLLESSPFLANLITTYATGANTIGSATSPLPGESEELAALRAPSHTPTADREHPQAMHNSVVTDALAVQCELNDQLRTAESALLGATLTISYLSERCTQLQVELDSAVDAEKNAQNQIRDLQAKHDTVLSNLRKEYGLATDEIQNARFEAEKFKNHYNALQQSIVEQRIKSTEDAEAYAVAHEELLQLKILHEIDMATNKAENDRLKLDLASSIEEIAHLEKLNEVQAMEDMRERLLEVDGLERGVKDWHQKIVELKQKMSRAEEGGKISRLVSVEALPHQSQSESISRGRSVDGPLDTDSTTGYQKSTEQIGEQRIPAEEEEERVTTLRRQRYEEREAASRMAALQRRREEEAEARRAARHAKQLDGTIDSDTWRRSTPFTGAPNRYSNFSRSTMSTGLSIDWAGLMGS